MVDDVRSLDPRLLDKRGKTTRPLRWGVRGRRSSTAAEDAAPYRQAVRKGAYTRKRGQERAPSSGGVVQGGRERVRAKRARGKTRKRE